MRQVVPSTGHRREHSISPTDISPNRGLQRNAVSAAHSGMEHQQYRGILTHEKQSFSAIQACPAVSVVRRRDILSLHYTHHEKTWFIVNRCAIYDVLPPRFIMIDNTTQGNRIRCEFGSQAGLYHRRAAVTSPWDSSKIYKKLPEIRFSGRHSMCKSVFPLFPCGNAPADTFDSKGN